MILTEHPEELPLEAKSKDEISSDYKKMFGDESFVDFELHMSDQKVLKTHKVVLAARSPVFYAMLKNDMQEAKEGSVNVPDFDSELMKEVLRYIYYNQVENLEEIAEKLIFAAEKYNIEGLKKMCIDHIITSLTTENLIKALIIADQISDSSKLFDECLSLIMT